VVRPRASAAIALALLAAAPAARGDAPDAPEVPAVAVISSVEGDPLTETVRLELRNLGFAPVILTADRDELSLSQVADIARTVGAAAAVHIRHAPAAVEIWTADRAARRVELRDVLIPDAEEALPDAVVAMRATDLVRAALLERRDGATVVAKAAAAPAPQPPRVELAAALGPVGVWTPGGVGPLGGGALSLRAWSAGGLGASLRVTSTVAPSVATAEGTVDAAVHSVALLAGRRWPARGGRIGAFAEAGATAVWVHATATPDTGFVASARDEFTAGAVGAAGTTFGLTDHVRLYAELAGGVCPGRAVVEANGRALAAWGRAFVMVSPGLEVVWP
jgi:hypothetical protein